MFFPPQESAIKNQEIYGLINALCRISSKAMKQVLTREDIAEQLDKARLSEARTWVADIAQALREG